MVAELDALNVADRILFVGTDLLANSLDGPISLSATCAVVNLLGQNMRMQDLGLEQSETGALTGPSGVGKTTALVAIAGVVPIKSGDVTVFDRHWRICRGSRSAEQQSHRTSPSGRLFVALALAEALLPLRCVVSDLGRMVGAAQRVAPQISTWPPSPRSAEFGARPLFVLKRPDITFELEAGKAIVVTGPSGRANQPC